MFRNVNRRKTNCNQRNILLICFGIIVLISIYLTINTIENSLINKENSLLKTYICPELFSSSKGYFRVDFTENFPLNYSLICKSTDNLLIYILSTSKNFQRRKIIRETWANKENYQELNEICFIFLIGLPNNNLNKSFIQNLNEEALLYNDLIQLNIIETYQNVVYKEVGALKWSHLYASHIPFLFKTDDDLILDSLLLSDIIKYFLSNRTDHSLYLQKEKLMKNFLQQISQVDKFTLFKGKDMGGIKTFRNGKFGIHELAWNNEQLPPYCSGFGFLYSSFIRDRLYRASLCYANEYVPLVGDVFLSGFLAGAASVRCSGWSLSIAQPADGCATLFQQQPELLVCSTPLHRGREIYTDFYRAWQTVLRRHPTTFEKTVPPIFMTTTTPINQLINSTYLSNQTNILLKNSIKQDLPDQQNNSNRTENLIKQI